MATRPAPCQPEPPYLARCTGQPSFAQSDRLNQNTRAVNGRHRQPSKFKRVRQNLPNYEDCNAGARKCCKQPNGFKFCAATCLRHEVCTEKTLAVHAVSSCGILPVTTIGSRSSAYVSTNQSSEARSIMIPVMRRRI